VGDRKCALALEVVDPSLYNYVSRLNCQDTDLLTIDELQWALPLKQSSESYNVSALLNNSMASSKRPSRQVMLPSQYKHRAWW